MTEHSKYFQKVKNYYDKYLTGQSGGWNLDRVREAVAKGWITEAEFKEITGEDYEK